MVGVARELVRCAKEYEALDLKAAILDGEFFEGDAGIKKLSDYPTREEAQASVVALALSSAAALVAPRASALAC